MFNKALISALVLATTVAGASLFTADVASANPHLPGGLGGIKAPTGGLKLDPVSSQTGGNSNPNHGGGFGFHHGWGNDFVVESNYGGISCGTAAAIVRSHGFNGVQATSCGGGTFAFTAFKRGAVFEVAVSRSGHIVNVSVL